MKAPLHLFLLLLALAPISSGEEAENSSVETVIEPDSRWNVDKWPGKNQDWAASLKLFQHRADLIDKAKDPLGWANAQTNVSTILMLLTRFEEAELLTREILRLCEEHSGPDTLTTSSSLVGLAIVLMNKERSMEALPLVLRAQHIRQAKLGNTDTGLVPGLMLLAEIHVNLGQFTEAEAVSRSAAAILFKYYAESGKHKLIVSNVRFYLTYARRNKLTDQEIHARLEEERKKAGLGEKAFEEIWKEAMTPKAKDAEKK